MLIQKFYILKCFYMELIFKIRDINGKGYSVVREVNLKVYICLS